MSRRRIPPPAHDGSGAARADVDGCRKGAGCAVGFMRRIRPPGGRGPGVLRAILGVGTALGRRADLQHTILRPCTRSVGKELRSEGLPSARAPSPLQSDAPEVGQRAQLSAGRGVDPRGPKGPTGIEMGHRFACDSGRLQKNGPPLSCFRIILLSNHSAGCSFASVPEVEPPSRHPLDVALLRHGSVHVRSPRQPRPGHDAIARARARCEDAVVADLVGARRRNQGHQTFEEFVGNVVRSFGILVVGVSRIDAIAEADVRGIQGVQPRRARSRGGRRLGARRSASAGSRRSPSQGRSRPPARVKAGLG